MYNKIEVVLLNMLDAIKKIEVYTENYSSAKEFSLDSAKFDATIMNFIVIGEMTSKLPEDFKNKYTEIDWRKIYALRNILAHDYFGIDEEEVWQIVKNDLPVLKTQITKLISKI